MDIHIRTLNPKGQTYNMLLTLLYPPPFSNTAYPIELIFSDFSYLYIYQLFQKKKFKKVGGGPPLPADFTAWEKNSTFFLHLTNKKNCEISTTIYKKVFGKNGP